MAIWVALGTGTKWAPQILGSSWFLPCNLTPNAHHILTPLQMKPHALSSNLLPPSLSPSLPAACSYIVFSLTTSIAKWPKCQQAGQSPIPELPPDILLLPRLLQLGLGMAVRCHRDPSWFSSIPELQGVRQWLTSRVPYPELWGGGVVAPGSAGVPCHLCRCLTQTEQALQHAGTCGLFPHPQQHLSDSSRVLTLPSEAALLLSSWIYRSLTNSDAVGRRVYTYTQECLIIRGIRHIDFSSTFTTTYSVYMPHIYLTDSIFFFVFFHLHDYCLSFRRKLHP